MRHIEETTYLDNGRVEETARTSPLWVIPKELCTRCGACNVICPTNVIRFDNHDFPYIETPNCIDCGLCLKVCPGIEFDLQEHHQQMFQTDYPTHKMGGEYHKAYVGYARRPEIRQAGASGGIVTKLLISLLKNDMIDGAVVLGQNPDDPAMPVPYIARTEDEIWLAAQSKYSTVANTRVLREARGTEERLAFVGVACQIHGLKKLQEMNRRLASRITLVIGLACRGTLEREAIEDLLWARGIEPSDLHGVSHRGGKFPGKFQAHFKNGTTHDLHAFDFKNAAFTLMHRMYLPERCHMCSDYSAEFADLTCSDIWLRGPDGKYLHPEGETLVLCRTERGARVIEQFSTSGELVLNPVQPELVEKSYAHLRREEKVLPFLLINERRDQGKRVPEYHIDASVPLADLPYLRTYRSTFMLKQYPVLRRLIMRIIFSPVGTALVWANMQQKILRVRYRRWKAQPQPTAPAILVLILVLLTIFSIIRLIARVISQSGATIVVGVFYLTNLFMEGMEYLSALEAVV
ncbi:MAG: Coenzyme F420 hydrogenase/dehydrogenase, beta subunit C-terminal domain [Candidatus Methanoperedens sp.]|nr:Coenzyme F420 hydrogenase/dehydrogenase, beta subunit C-terminal domain [Candidatus Methanoperedens sp.]